MHRKSILGIMGGQRYVKVTKGHQVQTFLGGGGDLVLESVTMHIIKSKKKGIFLKTKSRNMCSMFRVSSAFYLPKMYLKRKRKLC